MNGEKKMKRGKEGKKKRKREKGTNREEGGRKRVSRIRSEKKKKNWHAFEKNVLMLLLSI